jgi:transposase
MAATSSKASAGSPSKDDRNRWLSLDSRNSILEGLHNKMEMLSRRAYGFRKFENYRIRVLAHCGG